MLDWMEESLMSDEGTVIRPEHIFKKFIWRNSMEVGDSMEKFTTWTIGGVAAIVGLIISNLDSVAKIVSPEGVKAAILLFTGSLISGAMSKQFGMAVASGVSTLRKTEELLNTQAGQQLMDNMTTSPRDLVKEMSEPWLWPLSTAMRRSGIAGLTDYVSADKRLVKLFCMQLYFNVAHGLLAVVALITMGLSISNTTPEARESPQPLPTTSSPNQSIRWLS